MAFGKPILLIIFNRPEMARQVAARVAGITPATVYIASDGPRSHVHGEEQKVAAARNAATTAFDRSCNVHTLYHAKNLGCKKAVQSALNWFFENESEGIVLEDDCLPDKSFFSYCDCLLDRYRDDLRIGMISGDNFQFDRLALESSYYFSRYAHVWGWASWRRTWNYYRSDKPFWEEVQKSALLKTVFNRQKVRAHWEKIFDKVYADQIDTWDYQLNLSLWSQHMVSIIPANNLVTNIGFDKTATHTKFETIFSRVESNAMPLPLTHPTFVIRNVQADQFFERMYLSYKHRIVSRLKALMPS